VEIFFVLSGYLITSLLLAELERTGTLALSSFWGRRVRRLWPALWLAVAGSLLIAQWVASDAVRSLVRYLPAALLGYANWAFIVTGQAYAMAVERPPLFLHLWSLGIETQFYLVWPVLLLGVWWLLRRFGTHETQGRRRYRGLALACAAAATMSAGWMAWLSTRPIDITRSYFGTDARLSGLLWGAALATWCGTTAPPSEHRRHWSRVGLAWAAMAALIWAMAHFTSQAASTFLWGIGATGPLTAVLLWATRTGVPERRFGWSEPLTTVLARGPLPWVGRLSYSLYLWHWPIFAVTRPTFDLEVAPLSLLLLRFGLSFCAAALSYYWVERPARRLRWKPRSGSGRWQWVGVLAGVLGVLVGVSGTAWGFGVLSRHHRTTSGASARATTFAAQPATLSTPSADPVTHLVDSAPRTESVIQAMPTVVTTPSAVSSNLPIVRGASPFPTRIEPLEPGTRKTLTLLSDSVTLLLGPPLRTALPGWQVEVLGRPALMVKQVVHEFLEERSVGAIVVVGLAYNSLFEKERLHYERWAAIWDKEADRLIQTLKACGAKRIIWITVREPSPELVTDAGKHQFEQYAWFFPYVNERIRLLPTRHAHVVLADWRSVANVPEITTDLIHLNPAGAKLMSETIARAILGTSAPSELYGASANVE
jgi:peptidoglycan/LPS O-acetylase OafA/YrhL